MASLVRNILGRIALRVRPQQVRCFSQRRRFLSGFGTEGTPPSRGLLKAAAAVCGAVGASFLAYSLVRNPPVVNAAVAFNDGNSLRGRREQFNFIADVVALSAPSVVYIEIKDSRKIDYFSGHPATVSNGSGFIVQEDGLILTNAHVVTSMPRSTVQVRLHDGRVFIGKVEHVDMRSDLATVRIPVKGLPVMKLGQSADLHPGEWVVALGSPLALSNTVTAGVVSSTERGSAELGLSGRDMSYIQTDAAITFGNSGGPLVNLDGEAIGINSMKVTSGISFAIPIDYAKDFLAKASGKAPLSTKKFLGITMLSITPDIFKILRQKYPNMSSNITHGVLVWKVIAGSPAHGSGVYPGDIITHIEDTPINNANDVYKFLNGETGQQFSLRIVRDNRIMEINVRPDDQFS